MRIPKEIVEKMEQVNSLMAEIDEWLDKNIDTDGSKHCYPKSFRGYEHDDWYNFADEPKGDRQDDADDAEYCDQYQVGEDSFSGQYYYPTEKGNYFWFDFWL